RNDIGLDGFPTDPNHPFNRARKACTHKRLASLGLLTGFLEGWPFGDAVYFTFITGLTIGYGDLVPRQTWRALAIGIGFFGLFVTGVIAAIAVHAMRSPIARVAVSILISTR